MIPPRRPPEAGASRPALTVLVTGTGTEVGKTWLTCSVVGELRERGLRVSARKPVQSLDPSEGKSDAELLAEATGEEPREVCPPELTYDKALAPPMAAHALGRPIPTTRDLAARLSWPAGCDVGLVEGAGGLRSPLSADGDNLGLIAELDPDLVVLVGEARLGVVSAVRLATGSLGSWRSVVFLNRFDATVEAHDLSAAWLRGEDRLDIVTGAAEVAARVLSRLAAAART